MHNYPPMPLSYGTKDSHHTATFGPELRKFIMTSDRCSFPIFDEKGNVLHTFQITNELRLMLA